MNIPSNTAPTESTNTQDIGPSLIRRAYNLACLGFGKAMNVFSFTALLAVIAWATLELNGYTPDGTADKIISGGVVVLMIYEIWKTTSSRQVSKKGFFVDLATGVLEFTVFWVATVIMIREHRMDYTSTTNWFMMIFTACDALFVPFNRFVLVFRQITSITDNSDHHHNHHGHEQAVAANQLH